jgi:hypothetical protein
MKKRSVEEGVPESDCVEDAPHPRHNHLLFGHGDAELQLLEAYRSGRLPQAWIIGGQEGVGKATLAWRFARFLFANPLFGSAGVARAHDLSVSPEHPVAHRIDSMSIGDLALLRREWNEKTKKHFTEIRMDDVRHALELFHHAAGEGGWRICIVDCAEDLNRSGANALLKVMEEPPPRSLFLIVSHRPARILPTIRSRCQRIPFRSLAADQVRAVLETTELAAADGSSLAAVACPTDPPELLELAEGSPGGLLAHRQQWQSLPEGLADRLLALGPDPLESLALARDLSEALEVDQQLWLLGWLQLAGWRRSLDPMRWRRLERLRAQLLGHGQPRLAWEVALLELVALPALPFGAGRPSGT